MNVLTEFWTLTLIGYLVILYRVFLKPKPRLTLEPICSGISVVIPIRNELNRLPELLKEIEGLNKRYDRLEVIMIDDHSETKWWNELPLPDTTIVHSQLSRGKKAAIKYGVERASNPLIFQCDADLDLNAVDFGSWNRNPNENLSLVSLKPRKGKGLLRALFDIEFCVLHFVGLESMKRKAPLLSNGAALLYSKNAFLETIDDRDDWDLASGDDMFLMYAIQKKWGSESLGVISSPDPIGVEFPDRLKPLFNQRKRWAGKSPNIASTWFKVVASFSGLVILGLPIALTLGLKNGSDVLFSTTLGMWILLGFVSIRAVSRLNRKDLIVYSPLFILLYPFYLFTLIIAILTRSPDWR